MDPRSSRVVKFRIMLQSIAQFLQIVSEATRLSSSQPTATGGRSSFAALQDVRVHTTTETCALPVVLHRIITVRTGELRSGRHTSQGVFIVHPMPRGQLRVCSLYGHTASNAWIVDTELGMGASCANISGGLGLGEGLAARPCDGEGGGCDDGLVAGACNGGDSGDEELATSSSSASKNVWLRHTVSSPSNCASSRV